MAKNDPAGGGFFSGKLRRSRRAKRQRLFPAGTDEAPQSPRQRPLKPQEGVHGSRRRRKHRRGVLSRWEVFLGFCMVWAILVSLVVIVELGSESEWYFVEYHLVNSIDQGTWIIGNKAYMPDGRVMELEQKTAGLSEGRDITNILGKGPRGRSLNWSRIATALFSLPIVVFLVSLLYRRVVRAKVDL